jgi:nitroimidazol reductase NimA-like FMN-containing flavoprotein (pyridoxamine 5'-phosphate oxidase superfamily)
VNGRPPGRRVWRRRVWVHEYILDRVPPFSYLPRFWALIAQLVIMEVVGLLSVVVFSLPPRSAIIGSLGIGIVIAWSTIAHLISQPLKLARLPKNPNDRITVSRYRRLIFNRRHYEAMGGSLLTLALIIYILLLGRHNLAYWIGDDPGVIPVALSFLLLFEICYRAGLGVWAALLASLRSSWLAKTVRERGGYVPYGSLDYLEKCDLRTMAMAYPAILLIPMTSVDVVLLIVVLAYSTTVVALSLNSILTLRRIPLYPDEIRELLATGSFAYFGTADKQGRPHVTPIIYVFDGKSAYIVTPLVSKKLRNLRENPNASLLIDIRDPDEPLKNRAALLTGKATIYGALRVVTHPFLMLRLRMLFHRKYPKYLEEYRERNDLLPEAWRTTILIHRLVIRVDVEEMLYWRQARLIELPS